MTKSEPKRANWGGTWRCTKCGATLDTGKQDENAVIEDGHTAGDRWRWSTDCECWEHFCRGTLSDGGVFTGAERVVPGPDGEKICGHCRFWQQHAMAWLQEPGLPEYNFLPSCGHPDAEFATCQADDTCERFRSSLEYRRTVALEKQTRMLEGAMSIADTDTYALRMLPVGKWTGRHEP
jgi:hypothetical protein